MWGVTKEIEFTTIHPSWLDFLNKFLFDLGTEQVLAPSPTHQDFQPFIMFLFFILRGIVFFLKTCIYNIDKRQEKSQ